MRLDLPEPALVTVEVLDVRGRRVRTLNPGSDLGIGAHLITWDGVDDAGALTAPGVFFVRVRAGAEMLVTRVVRLS
jgi:flagellar hook assembly protein FlgD